MRSNRRMVWAGALVSLAWIACSGGDGPVAAGVISSQELAERLDGEDRPIVLDVRTVEEFEGGHIPGAVNIPHTELAARIGELADARSEEIVVHCERGGRARSAEVVLEEAGFTQVRDLSGHMSAWRDGGFPVEQGESPGAATH